MSKIILTFPFKITLKSFMKKTLLCLSLFTSLTNLAFSQSGLIAKWSFNSSFSSSPTVIEQVNEGVTLGTDRFGGLNRAASFNGSSRIQVENLTSFQNLPSYTLSMWVKPGSASEQYLFSKGSPGRDMIIDIRTGKFETHIAPTATTYQFSSDPAPFVVNTWYLITSVYNGSTLKLYKDGVQVSSIAVTSPVAWTGQAMSIGSLVNDGLFYNGLMDDLEIYSIALTAEQVKNKYINESATDLLLYLPLNGDVKDYSPYNHVTSTVNAVTFENKGTNNSAGEFTGQSYINVTGSPVFNNLSSFTVSLLAKPTNASDQQIMIAKHTPGRDFVVEQLNGKFDGHVAITSPLTYNFAADPVAYTVNKWYSLALVYEANILSLYRNGIKVSEVVRTINSAWDGGLFQIGSLDGSNGFQGSLDEVKLYGRALSSTEIATIHNETITTLATTDISNSEFVAYPNPTTGLLTLPATVSNWTISDMLGNKIMEGQGNTLNITTITKGIYILKADDQFVKIEKQ